MPFAPPISTAPPRRNIAAASSLQQAQGDPPTYAQATLHLNKLGNWPASPTWQQVRETVDAVPGNDPRLCHPPCGVLPAHVKKELEQVLARLDRTGLVAAKESEQAYRKLALATDRLRSLRNLSPEPSAPALARIGGGLFDDDDAGGDVIRQKQLSKATKKIARISEEMEQRQLKYLKKIRALQSEIQQLESKRRFTPPPANPPPAGYRGRY